MLTPGRYAARGLFQRDSMSQGGRNPALAFALSHFAGGKPDSASHQVLLAELDFRSWPDPDQPDQDRLGPVFGVKWPKNARLEPFAFRPWLCEIVVGRRILSYLKVALSVSGT
jgi:hypothetical protein